MIFHWYLFAMLIGVWFFARATGQTYQVRVHGELQGRYSWWPALIVAVVLTVVAATRDRYIGDTNAYESSLETAAASWSAIPGILLSAGKDKGFTVFTVLFKSIFGADRYLYFGLIAAVCILCVVSVYRKYSCNFILSIFLFLASSDYVQWTHNGMRQFIAVCLAFAATDWLLQKKYLSYIAVVLFASTLHMTALMMIPMCFIVQGKPWNVKTVLFLAATLLSVSAVDELTNIITRFMENTQYAGEVDQFLSPEDDGANVLRVLVFAIPPILSLVFKARLEHADIPIINLSVGMSIASLGAYIISMFTSGIFIGRLPIYFSLYNYILLPWIIENAFEKKSAAFINAIMIACYMVFYYYQISIIWGL